MYASLLTRLVRAPGRSVAVLALVIAVLAIVGSRAPSNLADPPADDFADSSAQAYRTLARLDSARDNVGMSVIAHVDFGPDTWPNAAARARVASVAQQLGALDDVVRVRAPQADAATPAAAALTHQLIATDKHSAVLLVDATGGYGNGSLAEAAAAYDQRTPHVTIGGPAIVTHDINSQVSADLSAAETFAFPLLFLVSIFVFGSLVAAFMPLIVGGAAIVCTFAALVAWDALNDMSVFAINLVFAAGLGLAVDYSLLLITRVREARALGHDPRPAVLYATRATASTIVFSALTVAAAMASLTVFPQRFLWSMGLGGAMCALIAALMSLTLLPALLALLGDRVNALRIPLLQRRRDAQHMTADMDRGFWSRLARTVMRRPALVAVVTGALLLALASPVLRIHFVGVSASSLPAGNTARTVAETIDREFPGIGGSTDVIVADGDTTTAQLSAAVARAVKAATGSSRRDVDVIPPAVHDGDLVTLDLPVRGDAETDSARELVRSLRTTLAHDNTIAFVGVTGPTSVTVDTLSSIRAHLPAAILMTFLSTFVLVFLFTGSLILPLKAIVMNTLSVAAAMSVLVLVFQDGRFEHLLNFTSLGGIESSQPVLIVALAFGLSTDYGIILLSRIREERAHAVDDREAVARAVQHTGRLITSAALLLCIAIGAFLTSRIIFIQQVGLGTVTAVLLDATIVRALLVPSLMALLGRWNWWAPGPMRRIHDRFGVREAQLPTPSAVRDVSGETAKSVFG